MMVRRFQKSYLALDALFEAAQEFAAEEGFDGKLRFGLMVVLEELFTNAVKFSPPGDGELELHLEVESGLLTVALTDFNAKEFDFDPVFDESPSRSLNEREVGGLGLRFIREIMDTIEYCYEEPISRVVLTRRVDTHV